MMERTWAAWAFTDRSYSNLEGSDRRAELNGALRPSPRRQAPKRGAKWFVKVHSGSEHINYMELWSSPPCVCKGKVVFLILFV